MTTASSWPTAVLTAVADLPYRPQCTSRRSSLLSPGDALWNPRQPIRSNQSPAPTAPIAPSAPVPPMEPLEPPTYVPPFQPLERTAPIQPVAPVQLAQPLPSAQPVQRSPGVSVAERAAQITYLVLGVVEALIITRVILKLLAANPGLASCASSTTSPPRSWRPSRGSFRPP